MFWAAASELHYARWWINDLRTAAFFRAIKSHGHTIEVPEGSQAEYYRQWETAGTPESLLLEPFLSFAGGGYGTAGPRGFRLRGGATRQSYQRTLRRCHRILQRTDAWTTDLDWRELGIDKLCADDFVFIDPPYLASDVRCYSADDLDHKQLVRSLKTAKYRWMLTEYMHPLYVKAFGEPQWSRKVQVCGTLLNKPTDKPSRVECLWKNF